MPVLVAADEQSIASPAPDSEAEETTARSVPRPGKPIEEQAVHIAYAYEIKEIASFLGTGIGLSVLVYCDKIAVQHFWRPIVRKAGREPRVLEVRDEGRGGGLIPQSLQQRHLARLKQEMAALKEGQVLVIPHLDLLAGSAEGNLSNEARELTERLYTYPDRLILAFADRGCAAAPAAQGARAAAGHAAGTRDQGRPRGGAGSRRSLHRDHQGRRLLRAGQHRGGLGRAHAAAPHRPVAGHAEGQRADHRPHRQPTDPHVAVPVELAPVAGAGRRRPRRACAPGRSGPSACRRPGRHPADRRQRHPCRSRPQPARRSHAVRHPDARIMKRLKDFLLHPLVLAAIGFLLLALLIWYVGPLIGLDGEFTRLLAILLLAIVFGIVAGIKAWRRRRANRKLAKGLAGGSGASSTEREAKALEERWRLPVRGTCRVERKTLYRWGAGTLPAPTHFERPNISNDSHRQLGTPVRRYNQDMRH